MRTILKDNRWFFIPYFIFFVLGALLLFIDSKANTHIEFNTHHDSFFDLFFYYITFLGDGLVAVIITIIFLSIKYRWALLIGISTLLSSIITQVLKHTLFSNNVRPKKFFEGLREIYLVPGVENYLYNSFPSGHSTCAFSLYLSLAFIMKKKSVKFLFFVLALFVGYSRIYLSQHFFEDVYAGSLIGIVTATIVYYFIKKQNDARMEKSLISFFRN